MENGPKEFEQPPFIRVSGAIVPAEVINKRLAKVFEKLPRLWKEYAAHIQSYRSGMEIDQVSMSNILKDMSLRPEPFLEWDDEYFDDQFDETVRIARQRGIHDE